ncbi:3-dehydroquinate synthase [Acholeplasma equifetale]|uniref:3-dehydroquinate synthase n=1 Tax=Acholeplasma equifetale TaxID=264634 RepID=UPI0004794766|nr:3-dehydroquinate synthase [Acholeplasma equifetale]
MKLVLKNYNILIQNHLLNQLNLEIKKLYQHQDIFIITDENLYKIYHDTLKKELYDFHIHFVVIKPGEHSKSLKTYQEVVSKLIDLGMRRNHLMIAFGGGVVGDLAGFVAATLYRGVSFIQIPTSLLAMVDSSIGSKTGIDLDEGKNLVGAFYDPKVVFIDPIFLETLPEEEYKNGLAEVLKAGLIDDVSLFEYLKKYEKLTIDEIIKAIQVKQRIVTKDPFEKHERMYLNFGHTFGHAIEKHFQYAIKHGVAVSYGMLFSLEEGIKRGITKDKTLYDETKTILLRLGLINEPILDKKQFIKYLQFDKKHLADGLRFVFLEDKGNPIIQKGVVFND